MFLVVEKHRKHPTELVRDKYQAFFDNVQIIPLHQLPPSSGKGNALLGYIFCNQLAQLTSHTCRSVQNGMIGNNNGDANPSEPLIYNMLADASYQMGLVRASVMM
jgi:hypothetical protein